MSTFIDWLFNRKIQQFDDRNVDFVPVLQIVTKIIERCRVKQYSINVTKVNKLLYCVYGCVLAKYGKRLFNEDRFCARECGPWSILTSLTLKQIDFDDFVGIQCKQYDNLPNDYKELIEEVVDNFGTFTGNQLVKWTTCKDGPWYHATNKGKFYISDINIQRYFIKNILNNRG